MKRNSLLDIIYIYYNKILQDEYFFKYPTKFVEAEIMSNELDCIGSWEKVHNDFYQEYCLNRIKELSALKISFQILDTTRCHYYMNILKQSMGIRIKNYNNNILFPSIYKDYYNNYYITIPKKLWNECVLLVSDIFLDIDKIYNMDDNAYFKFNWNVVHIPVDNFKNYKRI